MGTQLKSAMGTLCLLVFAGCATRATLPFSQEQILSGKTLNQTDANFVTESYRIVQLDNLEGQLAAAQSGNRRIRELAAELVAKANQLYPQLEDAIKQNNISAPQRLPRDLQTRLDQIRRLRGAAFDMQYLTDQIASHQQAVQVFKAELARTQDSSMRALADQALPVVQETLDRLQALRGA